MYASAQLECDPTKGVTGSWDSYNIVEVKIDMSKKVTYKLATTVLFELVVQDETAGRVSFSGQVKRNKEETHKIVEDKYIDDFHLANIGRLIEDV